MEKMGVRHGHCGGASDRSFSCLPLCTATVSTVFRGVFSGVSDPPRGALSFPPYGQIGKGDRRGSDAVFAISVGSVFVFSLQPSADRIAESAFVVGRRQPESKRADRTNDRIFPAADRSYPVGWKIARDGFFAALYR